MRTRSGCSTVAVTWYGGCGGVTTATGALSGDQLRRPAWACTAT